MASAEGDGNAARPRYEPKAIGKEVTRRLSESKQDNSPGIASDAIRGPGDHARREWFGRTITDIRDPKGSIASNGWSRLGRVPDAPWIGMMRETGAVSCIC
jgi:hypothetical protein